MPAALSDQIAAERVGVLGKITVGEIVDVGRSWMDYAGWPSAPAGTTANGEVLAYTRQGATVYRLIPAPYDFALDAFYSTFSGGILSGLIVTRG